MVKWLNGYKDDLVKVGVDGNLCFSITN